MLHAAALLTLLWTARPLLTERGLLALAALFPLQLLLAQHFSLGRPDHHGLLLLLFVWQIGLALRGRPAAAGPAALALWISVEALPAALAPIAFGGAHWLVRGKGAVFAARYAGLLTAGVGAALLLERGGAALAPAHDSLSIVHLTLAALVALAAGAAARWPCRRRLAGPLAAAAIVAGMALLWPDFFAGPLADVEPRILRDWFASTAEVEPLGGLLVLAHLGLAALGLAATPWRDRRWAALGAALACYAALALWQQRWTGYAQLLATLPCAALLARLLAKPPAAFLPAAGVALSLAPLFAAAALPHDRRAGVGGCPLTAMAEHLSRAEPAPRVVMSFIFYGPELLWRSPHAVVATPYHRNGAGIGAALDFFASTDDEAARAIATRRNVGLALICPAEPEAGKYRNRPDALLARLERGAGPAWLAPIALPPALGAFRLYAVRL